MTQTRVVNIRQVSTFGVRIMRVNGGLEGEGVFGNPEPLRVDTPLNRVLCLLEFIDYFKHRMGLAFSHKWYDSGRGFQFCDWEYRQKVEALRGAVLGCVCKPKWCHGDVYVVYLNEGEAGLAALVRQLHGLVATYRTA